MTVYIRCPHCQQLIMTTQVMRKLPQWGCKNDLEHYWWQEKFCWPDQNDDDNRCIIHWRCMVCGQRQAIVSRWTGPIPNMDDDEADAGEEWKQ